MSETTLSAKDLALKKQRTMRLVRALLPIAGLIFVFILFSILTDGRLVTRLPLAMSTVYVIMISAMGVFFIMTVGGLDFSQGSILGLSAIVVCYVSHYSIELSILAGILTGACIGAVNGYFYVCRKIKSFIVTICTMFLFRGLIKYLTTEAPVSGDPMLVLRAVNAFTVTATAILLLISFIFFH